MVVSQIQAAGEGWRVSRGRRRSIPATGLQENPFLQLDQGRAGWRRVPAAAWPDFRGSRLLQPWHSYKKWELTSASALPSSSTLPCPLGCSHPSPPRFREASIPRVVAPGLGSSPLPWAHTQWVPSGRGAPPPAILGRGTRNPQAPGCCLTFCSISQPGSHTLGAFPLFPPSL